MGIADKVNVKELFETIKGAVLDAATKAVSNEEKFDMALDTAAAWVDERITWKWAGPLAPILEGADGPAIRRLMSLAVEMVFQALKAGGQVD